MKFSEAWPLYVKDKTLANYSPHTIRGYDIQCRLFVAHFDDPDIEEVTKDDIKNYLLHQVHLKPQSLAFRVKFIRSFYRWAVDEGYASKNPSANIQEPKLPSRVPKFLNEEHIEELREACKTRMERAIFEFLFNTGCRIGEAVTVNIRDIDWNRQSLVVMGKGQKEREVYFAAPCRIWLKKYIETRKDDVPALFITERRPYRRMSIDQMRYVLKRIAARAGVETNVYPHRLRHSMATHLLNNGAPMEAIQHLLGHSKLDTTMLYCQLTGERRREIYKKYF